MTRLVPILRQPEGEAMTVRARPPRRPRVSPWAAGFSALLHGAAGGCGSLGSPRVSPVCSCQTTSTDCCAPASGRGCRGQSTSAASAAPCSSAENPAAQGETRGRRGGRARTVIASPSG
ncbi:MAG: hypothetical protein EON47_13185, partial [Acetobacteraceae bacterium]